MDWKLTRSAVGEPEIRTRVDNDPAWGFSLLHELAKDPANGLVEIEEGVYLVDFTQRIDPDSTGWNSGGC